MKEKTGKARIVNTGPGTSIQDLGRISGSRYGIPSSGVMDRKSFFWVNHVLQNSEEAAVLEVAQPGLAIEFDAPTLISVAGAKAELSINSIPESNSGLLSIRKGDVLKIGKFRSGYRVYLGIKFGFQTEKFLESRSYFEPVTGKSMIQSGELLPFCPDLSIHPGSFSKPRWNTDWFEKGDLETYPGPDWNLLSQKQQEQLLKTSFHVSQMSNRMGIQLDELLENELPELPTNPVFPGTIQLTSGGKLLILMRDAGVTGGYPRVLQLTDTSISILSQKRPKDFIRFMLNDF